MSDWRTHIDEPAKEAARPTVRIKGTEVEVETVLGLLAAGWSAERICERFPNVTPADVLACIAYGKDAVEQLAFRRDVEQRLRRLDASHVIPDEQVWTDFEAKFGPLGPDAEDDES